MAKGWTKARRAKLSKKMKTLRRQKAGEVPLDLLLPRPKRKKYVKAPRAHDTRHEVALRLLDLLAKVLS